MNKYGVAVIGCGDRGSAHAAVWNERPDTRVVSVYDPDETRARELAAACGARSCQSYQEAISWEGVSAVSICVPTSFHSEITCFAAAHRRHVFCEKPLALTLGQGQEMLEAVSKAGVVFMPCFQLRDRSPYPQEKELFDRGVLGSPARFRFSDIRSVRPKPAMHSRSLNGGVVIDMACHMIDMMRYITGQEPDRVYATGAVFGGGKTTLSDISDLAIDEANIDVSFTGGHRLQMYLNWGLPEGFAGYEEQLLIGPDGMARLADGVCVVHTGGKAEELPGGSPGSARRIDRFMSAITGDRAADVDGADALVALQVSLAALESIKSGRPVELER
jgi:UDP-N-acetylglucosamine 3-dehydrogenase